MSHRPKLLALLGVPLIAAGCHSEPPRPAATIGMPNPASAYCIKQGGRLDIVKGPNGQYGLCTLPSGEKIEEWALFRRDHPAPAGP